MQNNVWKRHRNRLAACIALLLLIGSTMAASAATLGGLKSESIWAGSSQQQHFAKATVAWSGRQDQQIWDVSSATVRFFLNDGATQATSIEASHRIDLVVTYAAGSQTGSCTITTTTSSAAAYVKLNFDSASGSCSGDLTIQSLPVTSLSQVNIAIDGTAVVSSTTNDASTTSQSHPIAALSGKITQETSDSQIQWVTDSSQESSIVVDGAADPGNGELLVSTSDTQTTAFVATRQTAGTAHTYTYETGILTIAMGKNVTSPKKLTVIVIPTQTLTSTNSGYEITSYASTSQPTVQPCQLLVGQKSAETWNIDGTSFAPLNVADGWEYTCNSVTVNGGGVKLSFQLKNISGSTQNSSSVAFDFGRYPTSANSVSQFNVVTDNLPQMTTTISNSQISLSYNQQYNTIAPGESIHASIANYNFIFPTDPEATATIDATQATVDSGQYYSHAVIPYSVTSKASFPSTWKVQVSTSALICPATGDTATVNDGNISFTGSNGTYSISLNNSSLSNLLVWQNQTFSTGTGLDAISYSRGGPIALQGCS